MTLVTISHKASAVAFLAALALLAGCGGDEKPTDVVLVTHDSFAISEDVKEAFEAESGLTLRILKAGDAGEIVTRALLTAGNPEGDVLFGIDDNLLARALEGAVFDEYESPELANVDPEVVLDPEHRATPIDRGDVCLNYDKAWFDERDLAPPGTLAELTLPRYRDLVVVQSPATSTPGLAFMLATIAELGDGWQDYWRRLRANGVLVVDGWEDAYYARFSGSAGSKGKRPIVVSYASSPPAEVIFRDPRPSEAPTGVVEASCFRQIELAGVLRGARNADGARKLVDFMLSKRFQEDIPLQMFVFPVRTDAALPREFAEFAVVPERPLQLRPEQIEENRERWVDEWTAIVVR
ncbi:MAG TPA: thiamine ABC transporter substrate-binding protein [Gaiellaceae bacterium]|nr:thiamine ABC transporter substrate-binding protein [Gaiellaceae bacterium]